MQIVWNFNNLVTHDANVAAKCSRGLNIADLIAGTIEEGYRAP